MPRLLIAKYFSFARRFSRSFGRNLSVASLLALVLVSTILAIPSIVAQDQKSSEAVRPKRVLLLFSEARDLPGNAMMEQAIRAEMLKSGTNQIEFFAENLDSGRFSDAEQLQLFRDYLGKKYFEKNLDLVVAFMARDFELAEEL